MIPELIKRYVDTGKARYVYREFPLTSIHANAQKASEAAVCASEQGKYWEMSDKLFATEEWFAEGADAIGFFKAYAKELSLDTKSFDECLDSGRSATTVQGDLLAGESVGVNATPYFFVNDLPIRGGLEADAFGRVIDYVAAGGTMPEIEPQGDDFHTLGNRQSKAKMVAFVDYSNPDSAKHAAEILPQLRESYIDKDLLFYILQPWSDKDGSPSAQAATAAECAGQQGKYWEMHDKLLADQASWTQAAQPRPVLTSYAEALGLVKSEFESCLDSDWAKLRVQAGAIVAALYGIPAAPVFLFNNGQGLQGTPSLEEFKTQIDSILAQQ